MHVRACAHALAWVGATHEPACEWGGVVFWAGVVGSIVIALFLPLIKLMETLGGDAGGGE